MALESRVSAHRASRPASGAAVIVLALVVLVTPALDLARSQPISVGEESACPLEANPALVYGRMPMDVCRPPSPTSSPSARRC